MPVVRLYDTDLKLLSIWLEKYVENKMVGSNATLNAIMTQIQVMQPKLGAQHDVQLSTSSTRQPALQTPVHNS
jgi:hypothetical protein